MLLEPYLCSQVPIAEILIFLLGEDYPYGDLNPFFPQGEPLAMEGGSFLLYSYSQSVSGR